MYRCYCCAWTWNCTTTCTGILSWVEFEKSCAKDGNKCECESCLPSCLVGKFVYNKIYKWSLDLLRTVYRYILIRYGAVGNIYFLLNSLKSFWVWDESTFFKSLSSDTVGLLTWCKKFGYKFVMWYIHSLAIRRLKA